MKLFLFLACIRRVSSPEDSPPAATDRPATVAGSASPENQRRKGPLSWRPSLGAISEDRAAMAAKPAALPRSVSARPAVVDYAQRFDRSRSVRPHEGLPRSKSVSAGSAAGRVHRRANSDRQFGLPVIVPAFAPMGFMF